MDSVHDLAMRIPAQRQQQARTWMMHTIEHRLHEHFFAHSGVKKAMARIEQDVMALKMSPFTAAQKLLAIYRESNTFDKSS